MSTFFVFDINLVVLHASAAFKAVNKLYDTFYNIS